MVINGRTDLASEANSLCRARAECAAELPGVKAQQELVNGLSVTTVEVFSAEGAAQLQKPQGRYYTLELPTRFERGAEQFSAAAEAISLLLRRCLDRTREGCVLIAALGNPDITPDAVGSLAAESILVTRHLKQSEPAAFARFRATALCRTGVMGTTGMESALQIKTLCREIRPACVIAIDALAGSDLARLCRSIQICTSGIAPGSGVGNDREALNEETLGVPVIALGVPTVVDAASFAQDSALASLFETPRAIDSAVRSLGRLIGYGIDLALHPGLCVEDIDMLIG